MRPTRPVSQADLDALYAAAYADEPFVTVVATPPATKDVMGSNHVRIHVSLDERREGEGQGLQTHDDRPSLGLHDRGRGPGDRFSLPYFRVPDLAQALERVVELGGSVVHPGERWAICRDSEGSPFGLAQRPTA